MSKKAKSAKPKKASSKPGTAAPAAPSKKGPYRVIATRDGFYDNARRREGNVFTIQNEREFSEKWMAYVDGNTQERTTTGQQVLNQGHDATLLDAIERQKATATGGANPLGAE
jgi:hypothetical protein